MTRSEFEWWEKAFLAALAAGRGYSCAEVADAAVHAWRARRQRVAEVAGYREEPSNRSDR